MNMMKNYLGRAYTNNYLRNFCLYWMKAESRRPKWENTAEGLAAYVEWRSQNDMDCLYFNGDLKADTLMSAWTPIKWVLNYFGISMAKNESDLTELAENRDLYLPPNHELVKLLDMFLEYAEQRGNYILLPCSAMNRERYNVKIHGETVKLYDEVPATLFHVFEKDSLGKYFLKENGELDNEKVVDWIETEKLHFGFKDNTISQDNVVPLVEGLNPSEAKFFTEENEIKEALRCMIDFLKKRQGLF